MKKIMGVLLTLTGIVFLFVRLGDCLVFGGCRKRLCPDSVRKFYRRWV